MDNKTEQPEVYTKSEVAKKLNVSEQTARKIMIQPNFPSFKLGAKLLVRVKDFDKWFEGIVGNKISTDDSINKFKNLSKKEKE